MKKVIMFLLTIFVIFSMAGNASSLMLSLEPKLPDILSNSTGTYSYDTSTGLMSFDATALTLTDDGVNISFIDNGTYSANFYVDNNGDFIEGVSGNDLEIYGDIDTDNDGVYDMSGLLVSGNVNNFGFQHVSGKISLFDFTFDSTGGILDSFYTEGGYNIATAENSTFFGSWNTSHHGSKIKHDTTPVPNPEPSTIILMLLGLGSMFMFVKRCS